MKLNAYTQETVFDDLQAEWNDLVGRSTTNTIFCTWEWQSTWWRTYQPGKLWIVTCRDQSDKLVGIGSWFIHNVEGERVLRTIGCVDVTDYVDLIIDATYAEQVQNCLATFLLEHADQFDRINLCNIPEASPTCSGFIAMLQSKGFEAEMVLQEVCPIIPLPDEWEQYLEKLDKKERHEIRRKIRRAEGEADLQWVVVNDTHNQPAMYQQFIDLMRASHPQKAKFLEESQNLAFFQEILPTLYEKGWLKLSFLMIDGVPSATYCDFDYNNQILVYNSGLQPDKNSHLSPGIVLLSYNIKDAIKAHRSVFDFLRGNENYKYRMGAQDTRVFMLKARLN